VPTTPKPWERQPGEGPRPWAARQAYIQMGPSRSLDQVRQKFGKSSRLIARYSSRWRWVESAAAYDAMVAEEAARKAFDVQVERARDEAERWARRDEQFPEMLWGPFSFLHAKLVDAAKEKGQGQDVRELAALVRALALAAQMADRAREVVAERKAVLAREPTADEADADRPGDLSEAAEAALRAFARQLDEAEGRS
jgi:hypothetical protein